MKYSLSDLLDCLVEDPNCPFAYYFNFTPDMVFDLRHHLEQYHSQINRTIQICPSPFEICRLRRLALEILIV